MSGTTGSAAVVNAGCPHEFWVDGGSNLVCTSRHDTDDTYPRGHVHVGDGGVTDDRPQCPVAFRSAVGPLRCTQRKGHRFGWHTHVTDDHQLVWTDASQLSVRLDRRVA